MNYIALRALRHFVRGFASTVLDSVLGSTQYKPPSIRYDSHSTNHPTIRVRPTYAVAHSQTAPHTRAPHDHDRRPHGPHRPHRRTLELRRLSSWWLSRCRRSSCEGAGTVQRESTCAGRHGSRACHRPKRKRVTWAPYGCLQRLLHLQMLQLVQMVRLRLRLLQQLGLGRQLRRCRRCQLWCQPQR